MKDWTWQKWVGKILLLLVGVLELILQLFEITTWGWAPTIITLLTWLAQFIIGLIPPKEPSP